MGRLVSAVVLFYALEKLAVLLAVPLLLGAAWLKYKVHRMDGDKWDRYFRTMPNGKYAALFFVFYTIPLLIAAGAAFLPQGVRGGHRPAGRGRAADRGL